MGRDGTAGGAWMRAASRCDIFGGLVQRATKPPSVNWRAAPSARGRCPDGSPTAPGAEPARAPPAPCLRNPYRPDQAEYELQFADSGDAHRMARFQMHLRCFAVWELERTKPS
jgi:hypothetical protein